MKIVSVLFLILLTFLGGIFLQRYLKKSTNTHDEVHHHAGFQVYDGDKLVDFSDFKYMHVNPCFTQDHSQVLTEEKIQEEKAHLHDNVGNVVHVHQPDAVWKDLFRNIGYKIDGNVTGHVNGEEVKNILAYPIKKYDSVVFVTRDTSDVESRLQNAVTKDHIISVENKSENCGS